MASSAAAMAAMATVARGLYPVLDTEALVGTVLHRFYRRTTSTDAGCLPCACVRPALRADRVEDLLVHLLDLRVGQWREGMPGWDLRIDGRCLQQNRCHARNMLLQLLRASEP